jgi:hypothetical protein
VADTQPDVAQAYENVRNWVELYDKKLTPVFVTKEDILKSPEKALEYASRNTGILVRANSAITTITGQKAAAEALLMIMRLILADTTEELMLYSNNDAALDNYHNGRYRVTEEMKKSYNQSVCNTDPYLADVVVKQICAGRKAKLPQLTNGKSFPEIFNSMLFQLETVEKSRRQEAEFAMQLVEAAIRAGQTAAATEQDTNDQLDMFK